MIRDGVKRMGVNLQLTGFGHIDTAFQVAELVFKAH